MGNRGSKSVIFALYEHKNITVKEQRVDGSYIGNPMLRCTLVGFERNSQTRILSNQRNYSNLQSELILKP